VAGLTYDYFNARLICKSHDSTTCNAFSFLAPYKFTNSCIFNVILKLLNPIFFSGNSAEGTDAPGLATLQERIAEAEDNLKVCNLYEAINLAVIQ